MSTPRMTTETLLPAASLWRREVIRFLRQRSRVLGALGSPVVFWLLIGTGLGSSFQEPGGGASYAEYFFPGTLVLILLFTAIFSTISIIDDRREGFLQSVLVAPVSRVSIVAGKVGGGATLAVLQGGVFLLLAPLAGISLEGPIQIILVLSVMILISIALTSIGFCIAWRMDSTQGFHAIMNLILIPIWMLSGALFPVSGAHAAVQVVMRVNPLFYCVQALRGSLCPGDLAAGSQYPSTSILTTAAFTMAAFLLAVVVGGRAGGVRSR